MSKSLLARMKHRVTICRLPGPDDTDEYGQPLDDPIPVTTVWAAIEPLRGREYFAAMAEHAEVTTRIRIRYREDIDRTMIVRYKEPGDPEFREFEILHVIHSEYRRRELQLMCKERQ